MTRAAEDSNGERVDGAPDLSSWARTYGPALRRFFARRVGHGDADEMVQDVFLAVHARRSDRHVDNPQGYLFRAAHHLIARRRSGFEPDGGEAADRLLDPISPERQLIAKQELERVLDAIRDLPPRAREAFILHRFEEMTYGNIAAHMGITLSAVRRLISRALHRIAAELERSR